MLALAGVAAAALTALVISGHFTSSQGTVAGTILLCRQEGCLTGSPIADLKVAFEQLDGVEVKVVATDSAGHYSVMLPPGHYAIECECPSPDPDRAGETRKQSFQFGPRDIWVKGGQNLAVNLGFPDLVQ
jgi:hypothetical protein